MLFYEITATIGKDMDVPSPRQKDEYEDYASAFPGYNEMFYQKSRKQNYLFVTMVNPKRIRIGAVIKGEDDIETVLKKYLKHTGLNVTVTEIEEVTVKTVIMMLRRADNSGFVSSIYDVLEDLDLETFNRHCDVSYTEDLISVEENTKESIISSANEILLDEYFVPEIERIYMGKACGKIKSHPVHYIIKSDAKATQSYIYTNLIFALYNNNRITNKRYCKLFFNENTDLYDNSLEGIYKSCAGGTVVVNFASKNQGSKSFANRNKDNVVKVCEMIEKYKNTVLTILCLPSECEKMINSFQENLQTVSFVEIAEDKVTGEKAQAYLKRLARKNKILVDKNLFFNLQENTFYNQSNLQNMFDEWLSHKLKTKIYPQYKDIKTVKATQLKEAPKGDAVKELEQLIGLKNAKKVITQALNFYKVQKLYADKGVSAERPAMHMIFTGNPGTAKTTVARLFAQIMKDNGLLSKGDLYEVGRADIVGQYVGQTAPLVKAMFRKAKGSVLFIDEAYSLVDDRDGLYGDEAINTIVQEMENNREDTVVIFAGYPDKMEQFLDKNPGLRSRIAFNIPFDDYNEDELLQIAELTAQKSNMQFSDEAKIKLKNLFIESKKSADFGNGRFVRNVFEKAKMEQANRLVNMNYADVTNDVLSTLTASDIVIPEKAKSQQTCKIGF